MTTKQSKWELLGVMELFCILTAVMVIQKYTCIKTHRTVHIPKNQFYHMKIIKKKFVPTELVPSWDGGGEILQL